MRNKWKIVSLVTIPTISLFAIPTSVSLIKNNDYKSISFVENNLIDVPFKILNQGLSKDSVNVVIVGEGYTESEQEKFLRTVEYYVKHLFNFPQYKRLKQYISIYALRTPSNVDLNKSPISPSVQDTYFESVKRNQKGIPDFSYYGKKKFNQLKEQIKNNVAQNNNLSKTHIAMNTGNIRAASFGGGSYSVTGDLVYESQNVFVHEMSHNFSLADEYTKNKVWPNSSTTNDPNTISWKNFLGFRNTGIRQTRDTEKDGILYFPSINGDCIMKNTHAKPSKFCEVCQYYSFKYIAENIKNGPMYISKPFISESFDNATGYNQIVEEITNENDDLYEYENEKIDMRFLVDNPTDKDIRIKLKLEFTNKTDSSKSQTKEQIFTIKPIKTDRPEPEQIKITLDKPIEFKSSDNISIVGYVYNADTNEMLVNTKGKSTGVGFEYEDQKQLTINFLDAKTKQNIDLINGPQKYNFHSEQDIKNINPIELRGYKFNKKEEVVGNKNEWNWYYDKKPERKLTLNLYNSVDKKLVETKQWSLFEGETFEPQQSDFMFTKQTLNGEVKFKNQKIAYNDSTSKIDYWIEYPEYKFKSTQNSYEIKQGDDFNLKDKVSIESKQNEGSWVKNELFTEQMIIESNNFNNYVVGDYKIKYIFRNIHTEISVKVIANSSLSQEQKDIIQEMNKLISNPIQLNATGKQTNIINVNKNNIKQYVDNWPINQNAVIVELAELKTIVSTGNVEIKFKFKKGNTELFHTTNVGRFISDEYDVDQEIKLLANFSFEIDNDKVKRTHISNVNDKNISSFIKNMPNSKNPNVKIEPYIQTRMDEIGQIALALKISKNYISKITNGVWVSGFKHGKTDTIIPPIVDSDELDRKTLDNEIQKINNNPITINDLGKTTNIKDVNSSNISTYVNNWPKVANNIILSVENFRTDLKQGSVTFDLKLSLNNSSKSINIYIDGFVVDKDDENIVQPPVKPPVEPPTPPVDNNTQRPPIVENPEVNRPTTNEVLSTNQKLAPWKIGLIAGSSLLGVGLVVLGIWWFIKIKKK